MTNNNMYFVANWKMFGSIKSVNSLKKVISYSKIKKRKLNIIYCPPYTLIKSFLDKTKNSNIKIGAQDCHSHSKYGPFTGAVSSKMIKDLGCEFVIIGHSETRTINNNKKINLKIQAALSEKLNVIFCIGEKLIEKKNNKTKSVLKKQLLEGLKNINNLNNIIIDYENVWSIGSGIIPTQNDLTKNIKFIKDTLKISKNNTKSKILYGGSVNPKNIKNLMRINNINGFLIGGASTNEKIFIDIMKKSIN
jgi:triosephosphate isomerase